MLETRCDKPSRDRKGGHLRIRMILFGLLVALAASPQDAPGTELSLEADVAPVKATYRDILGIIKQARMLVATANADSDDQYVSESLRLQDERVTLTLASGFSEHAIGGAPEVTYRAYYEYHNPKAPISAVTIRLSDAWRNLSVSGSSHEQVNALHGLLVQELGNHTTFMGGTGFRTAGGLILQISAYILMMVALLLMERVTRLSCLVLASLVYFSTWILPWDIWFPGTAIYLDSASFIVRYSAAISLAGVVATLLTFVLGIAYATYFAQPMGVANEPEDDLARPATELAASPSAESETRRRTKRPRKKRRR